MKDNTIEILHKDHRHWMSTLNFYQDEVKIFQNELLRVLQKHPDHFPLLEHVEEYQKILLKKLKRIDQLRTQIARHEHSIALNTESNKEEELSHEHMSKRMKKFDRKYNEMKRRMHRFISRND